MSIEVDDLRQIVDDILTSLSPDGSTDTLSAGPGEPGAPQDGDAGAVTAGIHISGAWSGTVLVRCSTRFASGTAAAMLDVPAEELSDEDVSDAMGEVANMIGGSVKAMLPEPSVLSLPMVTYGSRRSVVPGTELVQSLDLSPVGRELHVQVLQRRAAQERPEHA